jgi:hypothetical protein
VGGERTQFTRSERRALALLVGHPNRLLTRDQLLDAITGSGSDRSDRNVDFVINRLRRKLCDNARHPRYIATRYGEGYVWVGKSANIDVDHTGAYLIVGPLRGLNNLALSRERAERFGSDLYAALRSELPIHQRVVLAPNCPPAKEFGEQSPSLSVELSFFEEGQTVNCIAAAREFRSGHILTVHRLALPSGAPDGSMQCAARLARLLLDKIWRALATQTESGLPLPVLMHLASPHPDKDPGAITDSDRHLRKLASLQENRNLAAWRENEERLLSLRKLDPDDPFLKIMYATQIHSKYISLGHQLFRSGIDDRRRDENDIEALVLSALPQIQSNPEYAIIAAKLLHFLDRGYFELARTLAEEAYNSSIAAAGSLAVIGQLRAFAGETEAALRCIDQALNLVAPGSKAHLYTLSIKMQALRAIADFDRLNEAKRQFYRVSAAIMFLYEPMFADPGKLSIRAKAVMMMISRERAAAILQHTHYVSARLFLRPSHRTNVILTPLTLTIRRFGVGALPEEVAEAYPDILKQLV